MIATRQSAINTDASGINTKWNPATGILQQPPRNLAGSLQLFLEILVETYLILDYKSQHLLSRSNFEFCFENLEEVEIGVGYTVTLPLCLQRPIRERVVGCKMSGKNGKKAKNGN